MCSARGVLAAATQKRHNLAKTQHDPDAVQSNPAQRFFLSHKRMCLGTFSRRGAVALATIYPCAECASSRSIFIVWKRSFLYDKTKIPDRHESFSSTSVGNSIVNTTDLCSAHLLFFSSACLLQQAIVVSPSERYLPDVPEHRFP